MIARGASGLAWQEPTTSLPTLPAGAVAQPVWGFRDAAFSYEFHHVFGPVRFLPGRRVIEGQILDQDLSYWVATSLAETGSTTATGHWITYAQARKLKGSLTFSQFGMIEAMSVALPELLGLRTPDRSATPRRTTTVMDVTAPAVGLVPYRKP